jgi:hypothetical protein
MKDEHVPLFIGIIGFGSIFIFLFIFFTFNMPPADCDDLLEIHELYDNLTSNQKSYIVENC